MFHLNLSDFQKGLVMSVISGVFLPLAIIVQTPGFDFLHANWTSILDIALTGAAVGFVGYLVKNFFSNSQGQVLGKVG